MATTTDFYASLQHELEEIQAAGLLKTERTITSPQGSRIRTADGREVINLCGNNYLGLSSHRSVVEAAHAALDSRGFGVSGARTTCGTQDLHKELEARLSRFLGTEDTILYGSAYSANGGLFETLLGPDDAVIGDELNHASIVDGIRLCRAKHLRYRHDDIQDLRAQLQAAEEGGARYKLVFTDGVFSMDGTLARLGEIRALCDEFGALLGFDDSHSTGFVGRSGRGTHEYRGVFGKVDIITGTLGKALGGACGGFTSARREVVQVLRQRSRPYLFSNSLAPAIVGATLKALDLMEADTSLRDKLEENTRYFRAGLIARDFVVTPDEHPIIPVMLHDAGLTQRFARRLLELGVFVTGFAHPVVPEGQARIRVQISAQHTREQLDDALSAFAHVRREMAM